MKLRRIGQNFNPYFYIVKDTPFNKVYTEEEEIGQNAIIALNSLQDNNLGYIKIDLFH